MNANTDLFTLAWDHHQAGRFAEAEKLYRQIVAADPIYADAWCFLGAIVQAQGKLAEAETLYRRAVELAPDHPSAGNCLGIVLAQLHRPHDALAAMEQFIGQWPGDADAHNNLGLIQAQLGRLNEAVASYERALSLQPDHQGARGNWNQVRQLMGTSSTESVPRSPGSDPALVQTVRNLNQQGVTLAQKGRHAEARGYFENALRLDPADADAHVNIGTVYDLEQRLDEALHHYQQALLSQPRHAEAQYNSGVVLAKLGRFDEAIRCYRQTLQLQPGHLDARNNLANVLKDTGHFEEARVGIEETLQMNPNYGEGHLSRSLLLLLQGDFEHGWAGYNWRWKRAGHVHRTFAQPAWDGSPLNGRTILLHAEQGFGDTLQFIRYAPLVRQCGGRVLLECPPSLIALLRSAEGIDQFVASGTPLPDFDVQAALPSLPCIFQTSWQTLPARVPYLHADPALVQQWRERLATLRGLRVGIAWQGNAMYPGDRFRSVPLTRFAALAKVQGVQFVSLQKGPGAQQMRDWPGPAPLTDLGGNLDEAAGAFMDTAAIMKNLDLVISTDTAIPHLAGALGVPVWLAVQFVPDWRWLLNREDSPWYPSMRLFRQRTLGDWSEPFARMASQLQAQVAER